MTNQKRQDIAFRAAKERREDAFATNRRDEDRLIRACKVSDADVEHFEAIEQAASDAFYQNEDESTDDILKSVYDAAKADYEKAAERSSQCYADLSAWRKSQK